MSTARPRTWLITGVSSGFGRELAQAILARGDTVVGTMRQKAQLSAFEALAPGRAHGRILDVTDAAAIAPLVAEVEAKVGPIDVLVNNAGYGLGGAVEEIDDAEARHVMETNFFGTLNLIKAVVPHFRARRAGHLVNFSSMAGILGIPGVALYCAAKHAVSGLSEALAGELAPFGIRVTVVEPGGFRTNFAGGSLVLAKRTMSEYDGTPAARPRAMKEHYHGTQQGDPAKAAAAVIAIVDAPQPPVHFVLGPDAVAAARNKLARFGDEITAWEALSSGTNYSN